MKKIIAGLLALTFVFGGVDSYGTIDVEDAVMVIGQVNETRL